MCLPTRRDDVTAKALRDQIGQCADCDADIGAVYLHVPIYDLYLRLRHVWLADG